LLGLFGSSAQAQLVAKLNPLGLALETGSASVEYFLGRHFSAQIDGYWVPSAQREGTEFSGGGVGLSLRYYIGTDRRPTGLFVSPMVASLGASFQDLRGLRYQYGYTALGGQLGYQRSFGGLLTIELGVGAWQGLGIEKQQTFGVGEYFGEGTNLWLNLGLGLLIWGG
jgi:hypothetical protein